MATPTATASIAKGTNRGILKLVAKWVLPGWGSGLALVFMVPMAGDLTAAVADLGRAVLS